MPRKPGYGGIVVIWTFLTVGLLFGGQYWHYSWSTANAYASEMSLTGADVAVLHAQQEEKLHTDCALPIDQAMARVAGTDRNSLAAIGPEASTDMSPAAGWMHHPNYEAPPVWEEPPAPEPEPVLQYGQEGEEGEEADAEAAAAQPEAPAADQVPAPRAAPAPAPRAAPAPAPRA
ncbi:MAG: hypothetical protein JRH11_20650, partial [Deltaproteobacteria bacterium]|nr:hypothetical protein [Deltaproteobacteria bacterium]